VNSTQLNALFRYVAITLVMVFSSAALLFSLPANSASHTPSQVVSVAEGRKLFESKEVLLIDIRETSEHATGVAEGAQLLPMSQLRHRVSEIPSDPNQPVLIICNTQNRSSRVVKALREAGWKNVRYVHGGMSQWANNGWPMVKPSGPQ
jgi:rhodanese-related sulfurtransferase